jgi:hypothetical protein
LAAGFILDIDVCVLLLRDFMNYFRAAFRKCGSAKEATMARLTRISSAGIVAAVLLVIEITSLPLPAAAATDAERAALKRATMVCRAQVTLQAQLHDMSLWARYKAVKDCIKKNLANRSAN